jgi:hypothetical protein
MGAPSRSLSKLLLTLCSSFVVMLAVLVPGIAQAVRPSEYLFLPGVEYGEREIDFKLGTARKTGEDRFSAGSIGFGYGVSQHWFTEIYRKYERSGDEGTHFDAWEWENKFQLTETGEYPVDAGFIVEIEKPQDRTEGYEVLFGPLFQTEFGRTQLNGNILFEQHYQSDSSERAQLRYQWQAKYLWRPTFEFGIQGFGSFGSWNHWDPIEEPSHRMGPAIFGKIGLGGRHAIRYNAAWLVGTSSNGPSQNFRAQIEYEF